MQTLTFDDALKIAKDGKCVLIGKTAFPTRADAVAAAEKMRLRKIEAVKRQLAKLEALRFE